MHQNESWIVHLTRRQRSDSHLIACNRRSTCSSAIRKVNLFVPSVCIKGGMKQITWLRAALTFPYVVKFLCTDALLFDDFLFAQILGEVVVQPYSNVDD